MPRDAGEVGKSGTGPAERGDFLSGRLVMHLDMDAFFASIEQRDRPELKGKPVIVGGMHRGVVSAASYEARKYGIRSAMPMFQAARLCPRGVFVPVRMERYKDASREIMEILADASPLLEQVSIDEAYLDLTDPERRPENPVDYARRLKCAIREKTALTCSIGIAPNKFLAKIASEMRKPDGLMVIGEESVEAFLRTLPIEKAPGVGAKTARILRGLGVTVVSDIPRFPLKFWIRRLGKFGASLFEKARGIDPSPVEPFSEPKSFSCEDTFPRDSCAVEEIERWLRGQAERVEGDLRKHGFRGRTVTLKIKYSDFRMITRSRTLSEHTNEAGTIFRVASMLLRELGPEFGPSKSVRLAGLGVSNLSNGFHQLRLFPLPAKGMGERGR
jgi:DNA polymerase-4